MDAPPTLRRSRGPSSGAGGVYEEKTRNGNLRTLSRDGELAGARAKRPELI
jgi:hypothetical protein